jgi:hypothetical protein
MNVAYGQQDRPGGVVAGQVDGAVQAGGDLVDQPLVLQRLAEGGLDPATRAVGPAPAPRTPPAPSSPGRRHPRARPAGRPWWPHPPAAGPGHSAPTPFSLHQQQLDGQLLEGLPQPGRLGMGGLQLQSRLVGCTPGLEVARASSAPWRATSRMRMIVERSTSKRSAASLMVVSCRTSCSQISYFCDGDKNRLARRPIRSVPRWESGMIAPPVRASNPSRCWLIQRSICVTKADANQDCLGCARNNVRP